MGAPENGPAPGEPPGAATAGSGATPEPVAPQRPGMLLPVHRAPRFGAFIVTGALAGLVAGVVATVVAAPRDQALRVFVSVLLVTVLVGGLLGGLGALAADRRRGPRSP